MIEHITYKTKLEELLDIGYIIEIINKFTQNFEDNYSSENPNNESIKKDIAIINNRIIAVAKEQRRKELEKLLEQTSIRISQIDELLYDVNNEIMKLRKQPEIEDKEQQEYEYEQILNLHLTSKARLEEKRKTILQLITEL